MRRILFALLGATSLLLSGCASKEPMDYLPDAMMYFGMNMQVAESQPGAKKLMTALNKMQPTQMPPNDKLNKMFIAISPPSGGSAPTMYGVMTGMAGLKDKAFSDAKAQGGTATKVEGREAVQMTVPGQSQTAYLVAISDTGVAFVTDPAAFKTMIATAKKKNPSAAANATFQKLNTVIGSHPMSMAINAGTILSQAGGQLNMLNTINPKGAEALKQVQVVTLTFDWLEQPKIEATAYLPADKAKDLEGLATTGLAMMRMQPGMPAAVQNITKDLQVASDTDGVKISLAFPKEPSDAALVEIEKVAENLPKDPKERQTALQGAMMGFVGKMASGGAGGPQTVQMAPPSPGAVPQYTPAAGAGQPGVAPTAQYTPMAAPASGAAPARR